MAAIIGRKLGMTQIFDAEDGTSTPVTVIEAQPCVVTAIRNAERDGYDAVQLAGIETAERKLTKAELGHLKKSDAPPMRKLVEFRDAEITTGSPSAESEAEESAPEENSEGEGGGDGSERTEEAAGTAPEQDGESGGGPKLGDKVTVGSFEQGEKVKVSAISIGKGFQGTIKRHNFGRGPVSHGSHNVRAPGSIGASADPARVFRGQKMPGRMGGKRVTQRGSTVFRVDADRNLLLLVGSVPGPRNATVEVVSDG
ncbi:MAG: 50S ribosomal protein L3 [Solirubrobacterales bacterium]